MEFCERDYTQMRIIPLAVTLSSLCLSSSRLFRATESKKGCPEFNPFAATSLHVSARVWDRCRASRTRIMVDEGEQWIENCFIPRFLIHPGLEVSFVGNCVTMAPGSVVVHCKTQCNRM